MGSPAPSHQNHSPEQGAHGPWGSWLSVRRTLPPRPSAPLGWIHSSAVAAPCCSLSGGRRQRAEGRMGQCGEGASGASCSLVRVAGGGLVNDPLPTRGRLGWLRSLELPSLREMTSGASPAPWEGEGEGRVRGPWMSLRSRPKRGGRWWARLQPQRGPAPGTLARLSAGQWQGWVGGPGATRGGSQGRLCCGTLI